eukprot:g2272.t1
MSTTAATVLVIAIASVLSLLRVMRYFHVLGLWSEVLPRQDGKIWLLTGGSRGIGLEVARMLVDLGAIVIVGTRGEVKRTKRNVTTDNAGIVMLPLDLSSFASVRTFVKRAKQVTRETRIAGVINNAHFSGLHRPTPTEDGCEHSFQVNYLSHFLLTLLLLPSMERDARIIHVSSRMYRLGITDRKKYGNATRNLDSDLYDGSRVYPDTKLFQILFSNELQSRLDMDKHNSIVSQSIHPGSMVATKRGCLRGPEYVLAHRIEPLMMTLFGSDVFDAARAVVRVATSHSTGGPPGGRYWHQQREERLTRNATDAANRKWLWDESCAITGISSEEVAKALGRI